MARGVFVFGSAIVVLGAVFWQLILKEIVYVTVGLGRVTQNISEFPYKCREITDKRLSACEDLWLDDQERILYAACATTEGRLAWNEALGMLNVSGRREGGSEFLALSIDEEQADGSFPYHPIQPTGYVSSTGDSSLDLLGFDAVVSDKRTLQFYFVNHRIPVDAQGKHVDASKIGSNATIEVFELKRGSSSMKHLKTVWDPKTVYTPNNVAALGDGSFVATNDHSKLPGLRRELDMFIGGGDVVYCSPSSTCFTVTPPRTFRMPNGIARGADGLFYVPDSILGTVSIYSLTPSVDPESIPPTFTLVDTVKIGMSIDNFAQDANGDLWIPGFADGIKLLKWMGDPVNERLPAAIWRLKKEGSGYEVEKVLEDGQAEILNAITTVIHDVKTGRLFMGGAFNSFAVCDPIA